MTDTQLDQYVDSALALQGFDLAAATVAEVKEQFSRIHAIAALIIDLPLPVELEAPSGFVA